MTEIAQTDFSFNLSGEIAEALLSLSSDIVLYLSPRGVIQKVSSNNEELKNFLNNWIGKHWKGSVTDESEQKIDELLNFNENLLKNKWRHINHPISEGTYLPVSYSTLNVEAEGCIVAVGKELSQLAGLQQSLVNAQQSLERDYIRLRQVELRYRSLFNLTNSPVLIVDAYNLEIMEFNPSASKLVNLKSSSKSVTNSLDDFFDSNEIDKIRSFLKNVRNTKENHKIETFLKNLSPVTISSSLFKLEKNSFLIVQVVPREKNQKKENKHSSSILSAIDNAPDGFVITDEKGEITYTNSAFAEMVNLPNASVAVGDNFINWLVRGRIDFSIMLKTLYQNGILRLFSTQLSVEGPSLQVEISAVTVPLVDSQLFSFVIRSTGRRLNSSNLTPHQLSRSAEQLSELVGQLPLKDIVEETSSLIEKLCIESALNLTFNNRVSAAEMLGLSRQSLYVKMKKLNIGSSL